MTKHRILGFGRRARIAVALIVAAFLSLAAFGTANAAGMPAAHATTTLTTAQSRELQSRVDAYLAKVGGTQVAVNEIRLPSGADLLLTLPGEKTARRISTTAAPAATPNSLLDCPHYYICLFQNQNYTGDVISAYACGVYVQIPFANYGSWINNQSSGTVAGFYDYYYNDTPTAPAYSAETSFDWEPYYNVKAC